MLVRQCVSKNWTHVAFSTNFNKY